MQRQQAERDPLGHLQLFLAVMAEPERHERKRRPRHDGRRPVARQSPHEKKARERRQREARQHDQVVGDDGLHAAPQERRGGRGRDQRRVRVRERVPLGVEDVGVEEMPRVAERLVRRPGDLPRGEQRVAQVRHAFEEACLRPGDGDGESHEQREREQVLQPPTRADRADDGGHRAAPCAACRRRCRARRAVVCRGSLHHDLP
jgi:hypothetical protein